MKNLALFIMAVLVTVYATAQTFAIDSMKRILRATSSVDTNKVRIYLQLSNEWSKLNTDSALAYAERSFQLSSTLKYETGLADSRVATARVYMNMGEYAKAYEVYLEALHKFMIINDQPGMAGVYNDLGTTFSMQEDFPKAIGYFHRALSIYNKNDFKSSEASTLIKIGDTYQKSAQNDKALESYQKALQIAETSGDRKLAISAYNNIGTVYGEMNQYPKALGAFLRAKNLALITGSLSSTAEAYMNLGNTYRDLNKLDSSLKSFNTAINYFKQVGSKENIARTYAGLAELYYQKQFYEEAKGMADLSNEYAIEVNNQAIRFDNYNLLVNISKAEGDYIATSNYYDKVLQLKDSLYDAERNSSIEKLKTGYELEKKQATIEELKEDNQAKTSYLSRLRIAFIVVAASLLLLALSIFLIKRKNKLLLNQKKELEDLHLVKDKFFSILSHDLRSPMVNILGLLNLISEDDSISDADKRIMFESLKLSTTCTLETMDNMLAWGKLQIKENKSEIEEVNVQEVADRVCRFLKHSADNKSIRIVNQITSDIHIMADNNRLEFVLRNLMSNALKFSHKNGKVELWVSADDGFINIHVKDFGTGMKKEYQEKLFDLNKRQSIKGTAGEIGTGLGLILSKEFITQNKGSLLVNSELGKGTTFTIRHPWSLS